MSSGKGVWGARVRGTVRAAPAHEVDEHVLERRLAPPPALRAALAEGAGRGVEPLGVAPADMERRAEGGHHVHARKALERLGQLREIRTRHGPGREMRLAD